MNSTGPCFHRNLNSCVRATVSYIGNRNSHFMYKIMAEIQTIEARTIPLNFVTIL